MQVRNGDYLTLSFNGEGKLDPTGVPVDGKIIATNNTTRLTFIDSKKRSYVFTREELDQYYEQYSNLHPLPKWTPKKQTEKRSGQNGTNFDGTNLF